LKELIGEFDRVMIWLKKHLPPAQRVGCMGGPT
jgi:hypothetical protein